MGINFKAFEDLEFDPQRWAADQPAESQLWKTEPIYDLTFGGGSRTCMGHHFSFILTKIVLGSALRRFELSFKKGNKFVDFMLFGSKILFQLDITRKGEKLGG